jgi:hypothetical protein
MINKKVRFGWFDVIDDSDEGSFRKVYELGRKMVSNM